MERKIGNGVRRPHKRIVLRTRELRGPTSNYGVQKKETTRTQVRGHGTEKKLTMSPGDKSQTGYGFEKNIKIRAKEGHIGICEWKIDRSAEKRYYVLTYSLVKCSERSNLKMAGKNRPRSKLRRAPQAPSFGYEQYWLCQKMIRTFNCSELNFLQKLCGCIHISFCTGSEVGVWGFKDYHFWKNIMMYLLKWESRFTLGMDAAAKYRLYQKIL